MLTLVLDALATYRLTRLVTADVITRPLRERIVEATYRADGARVQWDDGELTVHLPGRPSVTANQWDHVPSRDDTPPKLATLVTCRWCTGMWVAMGVLVARRLFPRAWGAVAEALAFSAAAALVAGLEDD